jgi:hypothetical protein
MKMMKNIAVGNVLNITIWQNKNATGLNAPFGKTGSIEPRNFIDDLLLL